jgi:hypothetical protein
VHTSAAPEARVQWRDFSPLHPMSAAVAGAACSLQLCAPFNYVSLGQQPHVATRRGASYRRICRGRESSVSFSPLKLNQEIAVSQKSVRPLVEIPFPPTHVRAQLRSFFVVCCYSNVTITNCALQQRNKHAKSLFFKTVVTYRSSVTSNGTGNNAKSVTFKLRYPLPVS